jgi:2-C-methyl-D-erythritol 4-phosphate cytidylyltransferase
MVAVVLAGGSGQRFGADVPKQLLRLDGKTLIEHCVAAFETATGIDEILVVMAPGHTATAEEHLSGYKKVSGIIEGGTGRPDSTRAALSWLADRDPNCCVLLHDAARPLVSQQIIADCVDALRSHDAIGVAVPSSDTIVIAEDGIMQRMPRRDAALRCQTPQGFRLSVIRHAHELATADPDYAPTDDCGVVLRYLPEVPVHVVPGSERNIKITYPRDLALAEVLLKTEAP